MIRSRDLKGKENDFHFDFLNENLLNRNSLIQKRRVFRKKNFSCRSVSKEIRKVSFCNI